jgi:co-chaperonin GroES (HSP10)
MSEKIGPLRWQQCRLRHKWIIVKADPRVKKTRGGIELPDQQVAVERVMEGTGRILSIGNRQEIRDCVGDDLEPGMRICFRGFLKDAFQEFERDEDGCPIFLLRAEDVMAIIPEGVTMGAFS